MNSDNTGLMMKYFVLNPNKHDEYGEASRKAIVAYADSIKTTNSLLAHDLQQWIGQILLEKESKMLINGRSKTMTPENAKIYSYRLICNNCGSEEVREQQFGKSRPTNGICNHCGCVTNTYTLKE